MNFRAPLSIITPTFPPQIGGPASYLPRLIRYLREHTRLRVAVPAGSTIEEDDRVKYLFYRREYRIRYVDVLRNEAILANVIRREGWRAEILYLHGSSINHGLSTLGNSGPSRIVQKFTGYQPWEYMMARHGDQGMSLESFCLLSSRQLFSRYGAWVAMTDALCRRSLINSDYIIVPGPSLGGIVRALGVPGERIRVVYNPAPEADLAREFRPRRDEGRRRLVFAGRLVAHKGLEELVRWVASRPEYELVIVGSGPLEGALKDRVSSLNAANVRFTGALSRAALRDFLLHQADLFVLNSSYEGFSHVLIEAAAMGLRFVASDIPGNRDVVDLLGPAAGKLFSLHDDESFWRIVKESIEEPPGSEAIHRVRKAMHCELSEKHAFARTWECLASLAPLRPSRGNGVSPC